MSHPRDRRRPTWIPSAARYADQDAAQDADGWPRLVMDGARLPRDSKGFLRWPDRPHPLPLVGTAPAPDRYRDPLPNT
jgi:hypothetical protein